MIATSAVDCPVEQEGRLVAKQVVHVMLHGLPQLGQRVGVHDAKFGHTAFGFCCRPTHCILRTGRRREAGDDRTARRGSGNIGSHRTGLPILAKITLVDPTFRVAESSCKGAAAMVR